MLFKMAVKRTTVLATTQQRSLQVASHYLYNTSAPRTESRLLNALMADEEVNLKHDIGATATSVLTPAQGDVGSENKFEPNKGSSKRKNSWPPVRRKWAQTPSVATVDTPKRSGVFICHCVIEA